jgi:hypothetical protein
MGLGHSLFYVIAVPSSQLPNSQKLLKFLLNLPEFQEMNLMLLPVHIAKL